MRLYANQIQSWGRRCILVACIAAGACIVLAARANGEDRGAKPQSKPKQTAHAKAGKKAKKPVAAKTSGAPRASDEKAIRRVLQEKRDFDFHEVPLSDVITWLKDQLNIEIQIDQKAFEELGIATDLPITGHIRGVSAAAALSMLLRPHDLTWVVRDEVLLVTTRDQAQNMLETRVYSVSDLVTPTPSYHFEGMYVPGMMGGMGMGGMGGGMMGGMGGGMLSVPAQPGSSPPPKHPAGGDVKAGGHGGCRTPQPPEIGLNCLTWDDLVDVITSTVQPETWQEVGGPGSIVSAAGMLVISQTAETHQEIESMLAELRAASPGLQPVAIRATWLLLDSNQLDQLLSSKSGTERGIDRKALAEMAGKANGYVGAITCSNGQTVHIASGQSRSAVVSVIPVVGSGVGYQPLLGNPQSGAVLQVTPQLLPNTGAAVLDLQSVVTRLDGPAESIRFLTGEVSHAGGDGKGKEVAATGGTNITLDRVKLVVDQLATTLKVPLGEPTLVGGLTHESSTGEPAAAATPQLYLFIEVTAK